MCEVIRCSEAGFTKWVRIKASYALGVKTMNNGCGEMTKRTQTNRGISDKRDGLTVKWAECGLLRDHVVETGLASLVRDVFRFVEGDKGVDVLEAIEALVKAEMELNGKLEGGTLVPHRGAEEAFTF